MWFIIFNIIGFGYIAMNAYYFYKLQVQIKIFPARNNKKVIPLNEFFDSPTIMSHT